MGQQVLGGHGFIKEWGMEQIVRDARIGQIYEGANGIQALDLVGRKIMRDGGALMLELLEEMQASDVDAAYKAELTEACERLARSTRSIVARGKNDPHLPGAVSVDYLEMVGMTMCAWVWALMATQAPEDDFGVAKKATARYFYDRLLPKTLGLERSIEAEADAVMEMPQELFSPV
jgi:hypothetical protein